MAIPLKAPGDRIMAAVCDCCGAHAHEYPFEVFQVCARCGRGTYYAKPVTVAEHQAMLPSSIDPFTALREDEPDEFDLPFLEDGFYQDGESYYA